MPGPQTDHSQGPRAGQHGDGPETLEPLADLRTSGSRGTAASKPLSTRLPSIQESPKRRPSKASRTSSFSVDPNDSTVTKRGDAIDNSSNSNSKTGVTLATSGPATTAVRRASVPAAGVKSETPNLAARRGSKLSFAGIGRRVSSLVKVQHALKSLRRSSTKPEGEGDGDEAGRRAAETSPELPRSPRFSTFLSPQAQYAMMKGYEDILYEKIADSHPESRPTLKRNRTPHFSQLAISDGDGGGSSDKNSPRISSPSLSPSSPQGVKGWFQSSGNDSFSSAPVSTASFFPPKGAARSSPVLPATTATAAPSSQPSTASAAAISSTGGSSEGRPSNTPAPSPSPYLRPLRRQSLYDVSESCDVGGMEEAREGGGRWWGGQRSYSLSGLEGAAGAPLTSQQRLLLSYRLESAMDILDTLKDRKEGEGEGNPLSPRLHHRSPARPMQGDAVRDFNSWTREWSREFRDLLPAQ